MAFPTPNLGLVQTKTAGQNAWHTEYETNLNTLDTAVYARILKAIFTQSNSFIVGGGASTPVEKTLSETVAILVAAGLIPESLVTATNDFIIASGNGVVVKRTVAETLMILGITATPTASKTPIADAGGKLDGWLSVPEGRGLNYSLATSIVSDELVVALEDRGGSNCSASSKAFFGINSSIISLAAALAVTVPDSDVFGWNAGKIQGNDAQLFVYAIDNNGTLQIGVSPCPTLRTVEDNYYDSGGQTGFAGHTNIVMSGQRNATNSCVVIGRINVAQADVDDWEAPSTALIVNEPIWETDWKYWTPTYDGFSADPTSASLYRIVTNMIELEECETGAGESDDTVFTITAPIKASSTDYNNWYGLLGYIENDGGAVDSLGKVYLPNDQQTMTLLIIGAAWVNANGKRARFTGFSYRVS